MNGAVGVIVDQPSATPIVVGFTVANGRIVAIDIVGDPAKLTGIVGH